MISVSMKPKPFIDASINDDIKFEWIVADGIQYAYEFAHKAENSTIWTKQDPPIKSADSFIMLPRAFEKNISYEFKVRVWSETEQSDWSTIITSLNRIESVATIGEEKLRIVNNLDSDKNSEIKIKTKNGINEFDLVDPSSPAASKTRVKVGDSSTILSIAKDRINHVAYTNHIDTGKIPVYTNHNDNEGYSTYDDHINYSEARYTNHEDSYSQSDGHNNSAEHTIYGDHYNVYGDPNASGYLENWLYSETCNATTYTNENGTVIHANCGSGESDVYCPHADYSEGYAEKAYTESGYTASTEKVYSDSGYSAYVNHVDGGYSEFGDHIDTN